MELRKQSILKAVVREFTVTAIPVGSQILARRHLQDLSSATIRNELAELAGLGYLEQPHTSAGRIPTDLGYRYFVDCLMELDPVPTLLDDSIAKQLRIDPLIPSIWVERVARTLASVTRAAAVVTDPYESSTRFNHVVHDGVRNLVREPEFSEVEKIQGVLDLLEEDQLLAALIQDLTADANPQIVIGSEHQREQLRPCAIVLTTYGSSRRLKGVMGVIGPTRMDYGQVVGRLQAVAYHASRIMADS